MEGRKVSSLFQDFSYGPTENCYNELGSLINIIIYLCICRSPKLSLSNAKGISNEDVSELQKELQQMAAELVGEVRCIVFLS